MIQIMMGQKGTGKTKVLIDSVNAAAIREHGDVVCINKGNRFMYDLKHSVRLVDTDQFNICNFDVFYGLVCGVISNNFDISDVFVDSVLNIVKGDLKGLDEFLPKLEALSSKFNVNFTITISGNEKDAFGNILKHLITY